MPEVDKSISFNALHILLIISISNIIINSNWELIINGLYYVFSIDRPGFWFLMLHIFIAYIFLTALKIELGFHASIKLNL